MVGTAAWGAGPIRKSPPLDSSDIFAHGCGQQASLHRQPEMAQQARGWQTTVRSVTCRTVQPRVTSIRCDGGWDHGHHGLHSEQIVGSASLGTDSCVRACPGLSAGQARQAEHKAGRWLAQPPWGAESCDKSAPLNSWNFFRKWVWLARIYAQQAPNGAASIWMAPSRAVALLAYAVGSWVAKGANIMAVVVIAGCTTAWAWAVLVADRLVTGA